MKTQGLSRDEILKRLKRLSRDQVLRDFALFHKIVSLPKPTYMKGLNLSAEEYLLKRVQVIKPNNSKARPFIQLEPTQGPVTLDNVSLTFTSRVRRNKLTHSIQQAFGISPDSIESVVVRHLTLEIKPGEVILVIGPSGSGKTILVNFLAAGLAGWKDGEIKGNVSWPINYKPGTFKPTKSQKALVELMQGGDVSSALHLMGLVGLSDAFIYLKRFDELSRGQQYRAMLAMMIAGNYNVWLIDEFCANLDTVTANVVSDKLQSLARSLGATVVVAAPHCDAFISTLKPDKVIKLTTAWEHQILCGKEETQDLTPTNLQRGRILSLRLRPDFLQAVNLGHKVSTIRAGRKRIERGLLVLESAHKSILVRVSEVKYKRLSSLTDEEANKDGYANAQQLKKELCSIYPRLRPNSIVTLITFEKIGRSDVFL
jgi:ABC-type lipoprotein export system ATPase subunit